MTVYALSTAVLVPLTLVLTGSWPRRRALYFGTALGAAIGGAVAGELGFARLAWVGAPFVLAGLATLRINAREPGLLEAA